MHIYLIKNWAFCVLGTMTLVLSSMRVVQAQAHPQLWSKSIIAERGTPKNERRYFELGGISQEKTRLVGDFHLGEHLMEGQKNGAFIIEGFQSEDGRFWPNVELQVGVFHR